MPRSSLTDIEISEFRQRAIKCATSLFVEGGMDALTMRGVAGALDCSAMTPYRYFENLQEIVASVRAEAFRRFADEQEEAFQTAQGPEDRLLKLKDAYIDFALREPELYSLMFELPREEEQNYPELKSQSRRGFSYLVSATESAVEEGLMQGDPLTIAHILWANTHGLVSLHLSGKLLMGRGLQELSQIALHIPNT
jgi:AcrR family transcriptional regulator